MPNLFFIRDPWYSHIRSDTMNLFLRGRALHLPSITKSISFGQAPHIRTVLQHFSVRVRSTWSRPQSSSATNKALRGTESPGDFPVEDSRLLIHNGFFARGKHEPGKPFRETAPKKSRNRFSITVFFVNLLPKHKPFFIWPSLKYSPASTMSV